MEPAALLKPSGKNVASVNHFFGEKKILLEPAHRGPGCGLNRYQPPCVLVGGGGVKCCFDTMSNFE